MNRGGTDHLKLSKMNFAGAGPAMMEKLARDHKVRLASSGYSVPPSIVGPHG